MTCLLRAEFRIEKSSICTDMMSFRSGGPIQIVRGQVQSAVHSACSLNRARLTCLLPFTCPMLTAGMPLDLQVAVHQAVTAELMLRPNFSSLRTTSRAPTWV